MANLSERLNTLADALADGRFNDNEDDAWTCYEAKTLIDRLTVEGLAGALARFNFERGPDETEEAYEADIMGKWAKHRRFTEPAQALLTYITTPSVEESHD